MGGTACGGTKASCLRGKRLRMAGIRRFHRGLHTRLQEKELDNTGNDEDRDSGNCLLIFDGHTEERNGVSDVAHRQHFRRSEEIRTRARSAVRVGGAPTPPTPTPPTLLAPKRLPTLTLL